LPCVGYTVRSRTKYILYKYIRVLYANKTKTVKVIKTLFSNFFVKIITDAETLFEALKPSLGRLDEFFFVHDPGPPFHSLKNSSGDKVRPAT
jgi:hypothetical protein